MAPHPCTRTGWPGCAWHVRAHATPCHATPHRCTRPQAAHHHPASLHAQFKYRADDWKKVYVTFAPSGVQLSAPPGPQAPTEMLREVRAAAKPR